MRTRNKVIAQNTWTVASFPSGPWTTYGWPAGTRSGMSPTFGAYSLDIDRTTSYMTDQLGKAPRVGDVNHVKIEYNIAGSSTYTHAGSGANIGANVPDYTVYSGQYGLLAERSQIKSRIDALVRDPLTGSIPRVSIDWAPLDDKTVVSNLYNRARQPVVDGLLNAWEAPEIPSAIKSLTTFAPSYRNRWESMRHSLSRMSKDAANKYLAYSFGIAPLIGDINKTRAYLKRIEADYGRFKRREIRRVTTVSNGTFSFNNTSGDPELSYQGYARVYPVSRWILTYREKNPYNNEFLSKLHFLLNRFGGSGPASFAWERVPFSFVVDWFIDSSSVVSYLDDRLQADRIEVLNISRSNKAVVTSDCFRTVRGAASGIIRYDMRQGSVTHSLYERKALARTTYVAPQLRFGKKQAALSVALLRQTLLK